MSETNVPAMKAYRDGVAAEHDRLGAFQRGCAEWHAARFPDHGPFVVLVKAAEELGEIARALTGENEHRAGRGDVCDEAAQLVCVLASFVGRFYPHRNLLADARAELARYNKETP